MVSPWGLSRQLHLIPSRSKFKSREMLKYFRLLFALDYKDISFMLSRFSCIFLILKPLYYISDGGPLENQHLLKGYPPKQCEIKTCDKAIGQHLITNPGCVKIYTDDNFWIIGQARLSFNI